jgi:transcriptional regulator with XRE-family HTH domain
MGDAHINAAMLRWAMERAGASEDELAAAFKKPIDTIAGWLAGDAFPTFRQAQRLAKRLRVPFGFLFLAEPPADVVPLPDFRRVHGATRPTTSVDLRDVISDVLRKQDWYRDFRADSDEEPFPFVGAFPAGAPVNEVVADIAEKLSFEAEVRVQSQPSQFLRAFVRRVEALGILVMRNGIVRQATNRALDVDEFRGLLDRGPDGACHLCQQRRQRRRAGLHSRS